METKKIEIKSAVLADRGDGVKTVIEAGTHELPTDVADSLIKGGSAVHKKTKANKPIEIKPEVKNDA